MLYSGSTVRVPLADDQDAVEEFAADGADEAFGDAFARGHRGGVLMMSMPRRKTASNAAVNLPSRSRMRNRNGGGVVEVHEEVAGLLGQPGAGRVGGDAEDVHAAVARSMTKNTYSRRRVTWSTWNKSRPGSRGLRAQELSPDGLGRRRGAGDRDA